ncbi:hypothetical protein [Brunnivagina elsteri]|uniref:hypothetical protein n=1 Tax=Brunnivagina elsteri TaxID=1247191 RepID=UPI001303F482|nr:hypothetical protein [Calothrix elsteri]
MAFHPYSGLEVRDICGALAKWNCDRILVFGGLRSRLGLLGRCDRGLVFVECDRFFY